MRRSDPTIYPALLAASIVLTGAAGVAAGARLQTADRPLGPTAARAVIGFLPAETSSSAGPTYRFVEERSPLTPLRRPDVAAPKFLRIVIEPSGVSRLEGNGSPESQVLIKSEGVMIGAAVVDGLGHWAVTLDKKLQAGDHAITSVAAGRETTQPGDEVRVFVPHDFEGREVVAYERANNNDGTAPSDASTMRRAQDLATAANKRFSEIVRPEPEVSASKETAQGAAPPASRVRPGIDVATPLSDWFARASKTYKDTVAEKLAAPTSQGPMTTAQNTAPVGEPAQRTTPPATAPPSELDPLSAGAAAIKNWLKDANDTYDREIATPLSVTVPGSAPEKAEAAPKARPISPPVASPSVPRQKPPVTSNAAAEAARKVQQEIIVKQKALRDALLREEAAAKNTGETARREQEAKRRQAEEAAAKARDDERLAADRARKEAEARKIEEGMKRLEAAQRASDEREGKAAADAAKAKAATGQASLEARKAQAQAEADARKTAAADEAEADARKSRYAEQAKIAARKAESDVRQAKALARAQSIASAEQADEPSASAPDVRDEPPRVRVAQGDEPVVRSGRTARSQSRSKAVRVQGYRSRDNDVRQARRCSAGASVRRRGYMIYTVRPGDTLWGIANRHYRKGSRYNIIYRANRSHVRDADVIHPCQKIVVPLHGRKRHA